MTTIDDTLRILTKKVDALERESRERKGKDGGGYWLQFPNYNVVPPQTTIISKSR